MRIKSIFIILFLLISICLSAQTKKEKKNSCACGFTSLNQIGLLAGEKNDAFQLQTVNGFRYRTWMVGAGIGIDGYRYHSIPVFLQLRKEFNLKTNAVFIYNDIGLNYPWIKTEQKAFWTSGKFDEGIYYDGGLGYKLSIRKQAVVISSGFSLKEFRENRSTMSCPFAGACMEHKDVYHYSLKRLSFKLGFQL